MCVSPGLYINIYRYLCVWYVRHTYVYKYIHVVHLYIYIKIHMCVVIYIQRESNYKISSATTWTWKDGLLVGASAPAYGWAWPRQTLIYTDGFTIKLRTWQVSPSWGWPLAGSRADLCPSGTGTLWEGEFAPWHGARDPGGFQEARGRG